MNWYIKWVLIASAALVVILMAIILFIIYLRKCLRRKKEISNVKGRTVEMKETEVNENDTKISVYQNTEEDPVHNKPNIVLHHSVSLVDGPKERIDPIEGLPQVYMSVTSYDMVYMSQTSYDMIRNYRPSIPMPFKSIETTTSSKDLKSFESFESCVSSFENLSQRKLSETE